MNDKRIQYASLKLKLSVKGNVNSILHSFFLNAIAVVLPFNEEIETQFIRETRPENLTSHSLLRENRQKP